MSDFVFDIWYFAGLSSDVKAGKLVRREIAGEPICVGRRDDGSLFAMRDICPHRAAPFSAGCLKGGTVECPYHMAGALALRTGPVKRYRPSPPINRWKLKR